MLLSYLLKMKLKLMTGIKMPLNFTHLITERQLTKTRDPMLSIRHEVIQAVNKEEILLIRKLLQYKIN